MILLNQEGGTFIGKEKIYDCESKVSREDKIAFVDELQDGKLSYVLALEEKFNMDKEFMPKDSCENVKTVSLKAWLNKNDNRRIIDNWYRYGTVNLVGCQRWITNLQRKGGLGLYDDFVDEVFHNQLKKCEEEEKKYFLAHDEYSVLKAKFRNRDYNTTFGVKIVDSSDGALYVSKDGSFDEMREITMEELKELIEKYERLDALVEKLTADTHIVY